MKIFRAQAQEDTNDQRAELILNFDESVEHVVLAGFRNDHQLCWRFWFENINGRTWRCVCMRIGEGRWIPHVEALGFKAGRYDNLSDTDEE